MAVRENTFGELAVTVDELRLHLQLAIVDIGDGTPLMEQYIRSATDFLERATRTTLVRRSFTLTLEAFPRERFITIPCPPLLGVASVKYLDSVGQQQTLPALQYAVDTNGQPGRLCLLPGFSWPQTLAVPASVTVVFEAGYEVLPPLLRHAVLMLAGHFYANREATSDRRVNDVPFAVQSIVDLHAFVEAA